MGRGVSRPQRGQSPPSKALTDKGCICTVALLFLALRWQASGNLNNGGNAGVPYVNGNNALTNANWNILARATDSDTPAHERLDSLSFGRCLACAFRGHMVEN